ncbi:MAG: IgGFc-binding protein [Candidatus Kapabacteria bacterium]|jgi:hypothetical protein|nr:IgGFc-binding protein [Candidatus Kapabacteria bacterium]
MVLSFFLRSSAWNLCFVGVLLSHIALYAQNESATQNTPQSSVKPDKMREAVKATSEGREFWVCFQKNGLESDPAKRNSRSAQKEQLFLELFITSNEDTKYKVEIDGLLFKQEGRIRGGTVVSVRVDTAAQLRSSEIRERLAVHITAEKPVSVYGLSHRFQTTDSYMGLPVEALGKEYRVISYYKLNEELISQFAVIATEDSTEVTITPKSPTFAGREPEVPFTVKLRKGDVYQVIGASPGKNKPSDLTGSLVQSNKPISLFSGHNGAYIPSREKGYNQLVEQLPPISAWGRHYYVGKLFGRTKSTVRVVAAENDTKVFANGQLVAFLAAGDYYEDGNLSEHTQITGDKRIMVAQYSHGFENSLDSIGDPMMILLTPTQQFLKSYRMATPIRGEWRHYVNIVVPREASSTLRIDGKPVSEQAFTPFGDSRYVIAQISLAFGTHTFDCTEPFGLYSYGFGYGQDSYDAYGNMVGQSFLELRPVPDLLPPTMDISYTNVSNAKNDEVLRQTSGAETAQNRIKRSAADTLSAEEQFEILIRRRALARLQAEEQDFGKRLLKPITDAIGGKAKVLVRDDREDDKGIQAIRIINSGGLTIAEPTFTAGAPQAEIIFDEARQGASGRALLEVSDLAGNKAVYTLCFSKDPIGTDNLTTLTQGETDYCPKRTLWYAGILGFGGISSHEARFNQPAGIAAFQSIAAPGAFANDPSASILPLGAGVVVGHRISPLFGASARIAWERFPATLRAPDIASSGFVRNFDGTLAPLWLAQTLSLQNSYASLSLMGEVFITNGLYALVGAKGAFALSKTVETRAVVVTPDNFRLLDRPENAVRSFTGELPALQAFVPFAVGGFGVSIPVWRSLALSAEALYSHPLGSLLDGAEWRVSQFTLSIGARVRL